MRIKCDYCGSVFEDTLDRCPSCGAANAKRIVSDNKPRTIEELAQWYIDRSLPPAEVTRFFIGRNYTEPRAFGIYRNEQGEFVVYKNKDDGLETVKNEGRQDIKHKWSKIEDYWISAIRDGEDSKYHTKQIINPSEHLSYQMPEKPFEISEEDFKKTAVEKNNPQGLSTLRVILDFGLNLMTLPRSFDFEVYS